MQQSIRDTLVTMDGEHQYNTLKIKKKMVNKSHTYRSYTRHPGIYYPSNYPNNNLHRSIRIDRPLGLQTEDPERLNPDIVFPEYLELSFTNPDVDNMVNVKKLVLILELCSGNLHFPLSLLINLNEPIICEGKMYINLCFDFLFGEIKNVGLGFSDFVFKLINTENTDVYGINFIEDFGLLTNLSYLELSERRRIVQNNFEHIVQQITFIDIRTDINDQNKKTNIYNVYLPFSNISKGLFVECDNVDNINNIILKMDEHERLNYNKILLKLKCQKISNNLLYIPFNKKSYKENTSESYEGGINFDLQHYGITITFDIDVSNVKIYSLNANMYRQMAGCGGLAYENKLYYKIIGLTDSLLDLNQESEFYENNRPDNSLCPITLESFKDGDKYMACRKCKNNFSEEALKTWLRNKKNCPTCRSTWTNNKIYTNSLN